MTARIYPTIAQAIAASSRRTNTPLAWNPTDHLLSRVAFGPTTAARAWVAKNGPDKWYADQVNLIRTKPIYDGHVAIKAQAPLLMMSPYDLRQWLKGKGRDYAWDAMDQLGQVTLGLQAWSQCQLYEVLVDFFSNHLNVQNHNGDQFNTRAAYDREVIRKYAGGSFTNMLLASSKHPAMLNYLNLAQSTKTAVNENYGRELLELHTVGLRYSENDVKNTARILTGRIVTGNSGYAYDGSIHATGKVTVLGFTHANPSAGGGEKAGDDLLRYLASHPFTAQNLARKLCIRLVSDKPSTDLINAVAKAYLDNRTQILPMVSTILRSTEFWQARGAKIRRPAENLLATVRVLNIKPAVMADALQTLRWMAGDGGHAPLDWAAPNGYPDVASAWRSSGVLLTMWNWHQGFANGWWDMFTEPNPEDLYGGTPATSGEAITMMVKRLTGQTFTSTQVAALQTFLGESASTPITKSILRWWDGNLAALILNSPHVALR